MHSLSVCKYYHQESRIAPLLSTEERFFFCVLSQLLSTKCIEIVYSFLEKRKSIVVSFDFAGKKKNYGKAISSFPFFWLYFIIRIYEYDIKVKLFFSFHDKCIMVRYYSCLVRNLVNRYEIYVRISSIMSTNCRTLSLVDLQSWITMAACLSYTLSISMTSRFTGSSYSTRSNVESMINDEAVFYHVIFFRHFHLRLFNFAAKRKFNVLL